MLTIQRVKVAGGRGGKHCAVDDDRRRRDGPVPGEGPALSEARDFQRDQRVRAVDEISISALQRRRVRIANPSLISVAVGEIAERAAHSPVEGKQRVSGRGVVHVNFRRIEKLVVKRGGHVAAAIASTVTVPNAERCVDDIEFKNLAGKSIRNARLLKVSANRTPGDHCFRRHNTRAVRILSTA